MADTSKIGAANLMAAVARGYEIVRRWRQSGIIPNAGQREQQKPVEPRRMTIADQWQRLTDIVMGAATRAEEATRCHASATVQLDLAQYALTSLVDELSLVMDMGGRRRRATVHVLGFTPSRVTIGDAIAA